jgi:hypothetical protein
MHIYNIYVCIYIYNICICMYIFIYMCVFLYMHRYVLSHGCWHCFFRINTWDEKKHISQLFQSSKVLGSYQPLDLSIIYGISLIEPPSGVKQPDYFLLFGFIIYIYMYICIYIYTYKSIYIYSFRMVEALWLLGWIRRLNENCWRIWCVMPPSLALLMVETVHLP